MTTPPPLAHLVYQGDVAAFEARGQRCEFPTCHGLIQVRTLLRYRQGDRIIAAEHFFCTGHGEVFAAFYHVDIEAAPDESGMP